VTTNVDGSGIRVAQPEADYDLGTNWELIPPPPATQQPLYLLFRCRFDECLSEFLGTNSDHADGVGQVFYGIPNGVATSGAWDNYDAIIFNELCRNPALPGIGRRHSEQTSRSGIVVAEQQQVDSNTTIIRPDRTLFISGATNPQQHDVCARARPNNASAWGLSKFHHLYSIGLRLTMGAANRTHRLGET